MKARIRPAVALGLVAALAVLSACTVRPLYSNAPVRAGSSATMSDELSSIAIKPVTTREAQEVRNRLIFLFQGGKAQPATPAYSLDLTVVSRTEVVATVQVTTLDEEPSAASVTMIGTYRLTGSKDGGEVASGTRQVSASYDVPRQEFAALRARRDAENRSARELAELLRLAIAQDIARK